MSEMSNTNVSNNGMNEAGVYNEGLSPGRCSVVRTHGPGRHQDWNSNTVRIFSKDIDMEFGTSTFANVTIKAGKLVSLGGMELSFGEVTPELESDKGYKYLGILEANDIMYTEMKDKIQKEYYRRVRQLISSNLNCGNIIKAITSRAVSCILEY